MLEGKSSQHRLDSRLYGLLVQSSAQSRSILQSWPHGWGVHPGLAPDHSSLVFAPAFCQLKPYLSERQVMLMQEEKGSKAGEPKPQSCPPHLISEISVLGAVAKPAANLGSLQPGTERRCRSRSGYSTTDGFSLPPSVGSFGVGTCGSRALGQQMEQNFPSKFAFVNESLPTAPAAFTFLQECVFKV